MSEAGRRSRWWTDGDEPEDAESVEDPWSVGDEELGLSEEQVRFLESLADQPAASHVSGSPPWLAAPAPGPEPGGQPRPKADPDDDPGAETGD